MYMIVILYAAVAAAERNSRSKEARHGSLFDGFTATDFGCTESTWRNGGNDRGYRQAFSGFPPVAFQLSATFGPRTDVGPKASWRRAARQGNGRGGATFMRQNP